MTATIDDHREDLEDLADTDLPCARLAEVLLKLDSGAE